MAAEVPDGDPFFVVDLSAVLRKLQEWRELLPRVKPFYAIKCNPDPYICRLLKAGGCGFDCASQAEIQQVLDMGCSPEQIIYANPCKQPSMLKVCVFASMLLSSLLFFIFCKCACTHV
jgi:ornithine decarboxylase